MDWSSSSWNKPGKVGRSHIAGQLCWPQSLIVQVHVHYSTCMRLYSVHLSLEWFQIKRTSFLLPGYLLAPCSRSSSFKNGICHMMGYRLTSVHVNPSNYLLVSTQTIHGFTQFEHCAQHTHVLQYWLKHTTNHRWSTFENTVTCIYFLLVTQNAIFCTYNVNEVATCISEENRTAYFLHTCIVIYLIQKCTCTIRFSFLTSCANFCCKCSVGEVVWSLSTKEACSQVPFRGWVLVHVDLKMSHGRSHCRWSMECFHGW